MRISVFAALVAASFLIPVPDAGAAPDPTAEHKRVYAQINDDLGRMTKKPSSSIFPARRFLPRRPYGWKTAYPGRFR